MLALALGLGGCLVEAEAELDAELDADGFRIVDGQLTEDWPAVVGVTSSVGLCSGTQITDRLVLTAAHCLTGFDEAGALFEADPASVQIYWGSDLLAGLSGLPDPAFQGWRGATKIEIHPGWDYTLGLATDFALVFLDGPGYAEPIPIRTDDARVPVGTDVELVGFGTYEVLELDGGLAPQYDGRKRFGDAPLISLASLDPALAPLDDELYAADGSGLAANGCYGDSGGPLLGTHDGEDIVLGVASFVDSGVCDMTTLYSRVDVAEDFIDQYVGISPVLECVDELEDGTYVAHFGYMNRAPWTVAREPGSSNRFHPSSIDRGQPGAFAPGRHVDVFTVPFSGGNLVWTLGSKTATAGAGSSRCG